MLYKKFLFLFCFLLFNNCTITNVSKENLSIIRDNPFTNKGFALVFSDNLYNKEIVSKKIDERSLIIFQKNLRKNTKVQVTNLLNNKSIIATVGNSANYPLFNNSVLSIRIANELDLDINEPYIEILEILKDTVFMAKEAKTFEEEKKVAVKVPVNSISINDLNSTKIKKGNSTLSRNFSYEIKIADFYFNDTAEFLINRIKNETVIEDAKIKIISAKKYRVFLGPFTNINTLQKSFNDINILKFENIEIIKND